MKPRAHTIPGWLLVPVLVAAGCQQSPATKQAQPSESANAEVPSVDARSARQQALIDELMQREIYIYVDKGDNQFGRPLQALVLVGPGTEGHVRVGGKDLTIVEARAEFERIQELLSRELDLSTFTMVMDTRDEANKHRPEWADLSKLAWDIGIVYTPCGISYFPRGSVPAQSTVGSH